MADLGVRPDLTRAAASLVLVSAAVFAATLTAPSARADVVAYLVNVHMRPGYNFPKADAALIVSGLAGCQRTLPRADLAVAQLGSGLPVAAGVTP